AEEASYRVVPRENVERGLGIAHVLDDSRARIADRVTYIEKVWAEHYDDYYPRHLVSTIRLEASDGSDGEIAAAANVAVFVTAMSNGCTTQLAVGEYRDRIVFPNGIARFREKT